jgi:hypothetical protein
VTTNDFWQGVDRLVEGLDTQVALAHKVGALVARRLRLLGREVPPELALEERGATVANVVARTVLARARAVAGGPILVVKGPEVASRYPGKARRFADLDLLVPDPEGVHASLLAAGFVHSDRDNPIPAHHLSPIEWPGTGLPLEIHRRLRWPHPLTAPSNEELFRDAVPSSLGIEGLSTLPPAQHALFLVAHDWDLLPLNSLRDLVDIAALANEEDEVAMSKIADAWGLDRAWRTTQATLDWLLDDRSPPRAARIWARHLRPLRERSVLEAHLAQLLLPFSLLPARQSGRGFVRALRRAVRRQPGQSGGRKLRQIARALTHPFSSSSEHRRRSDRAQWLGRKGD